MTAASRTRTRRSACPQSGQATVEFALVLPLVIFLILAVLQTALIVRDYVATVHAAREAARAASVDRDPAAATHAARRVLRDASVSVGSRPAVGSPVSVTVHYRSRTSLPMVGALFTDPDLEATATMRAER
jgi:Flp pilus assembly protein TadG